MDILLHGCIFQDRCSSSSALSRGPLSVFVSDRDGNTNIVLNGVSVFPCADCRHHRGQGLPQEGRGISAASLFGFGFSQEGGGLSAASQSAAQASLRKEEEYSSSRRRRNRGISGASETALTSYQWSAVSLQEERSKNLPDLPFETSVKGFSAKLCLSEWFFVFFWKFWSGLLSVFADLCPGEEELLLLLLLLLHLLLLLLLLLLPG